MWAVVLADVEYFFYCLIDLFIVFLFYDMHNVHLCAALGRAATTLVVANGESKSI